MKTEEAKSLIVNRGRIDADNFNFAFYFEGDPDNYWDVFCNDNFSVEACVAELREEARLGTLDMRGLPPKTIEAIKALL